MEAGSFRNYQLQRPLTGSRGLEQDLGTGGLAQLLHAVAHLHSLCLCTKSCTLDPKGGFEYRLFSPELLPAKDCGTWLEDRSQRCLAIAAAGFGLPTQIQGKLGPSVHMGYSLPWIKCFPRSGKAEQDRRVPASTSWPKCLLHAP